MFGDDVFVASEDVAGWDLFPEGGEMVGVPYHTNRWRMRGPDYEETRPAGVRRIIVAGDSTPFGHGLTWDETFTAVLTHLREQRFPEVTYESANCAVPGHTTFQTIEKLRWQCLAFEPDLVVIGNQFCDATLVEQPDREILLKNRYVPPDPRLEHLALFRLMRNLYLRLFAYDDGLGSVVQMGHIRPVPVHEGGVLRVSHEEFDANLREEIKLVRAAGARPVLLVLPTDFDLGGGQPLPIHVRYREIIHEVGESEGVTVVDAVPTFNDLPVVGTFFIDSYHPAPMGARIIGQLIDEALGDQAP